MILTAKNFLISIGIVMLALLLGILIWNFVTNFAPRRPETPAPAPISGRGPSSPARGLV